MWEVSWSGGKDDVRGRLGSLGDMSAPLSSMSMLFSASREASPLDSVRVSGSLTPGNVRRV